MSKKNLPIGYDNFREVMEGGFYYVDKTLFIKTLLDRKGKANLFTRPRRFGKSLNLSMLRYFFEDTGDEEMNIRNRSLFSGLKIMGAGEEYLSGMTGYPVISLTLKGAKQPDFYLAMVSIKRQIANEFRRHEKIAGKLGSRKERFMKIMLEQGDEGDYIDSLAFLSQCLEAVYKKRCIILVDEYDVPLENAWFAGFYEEMSSFIRSLFESALKTNECLEFAVVTGCLRISRESIFTGLNSLEISSVLDVDYGEYFGFLQVEVDEMLGYYGLDAKRELIREWYDGYCFGKSEIYNPWSVAKYVKELSSNEDGLPTPYWANTSSNSIVRTLVEQADNTVKEEIEDLIAGKGIEKPIHEDITYEDIYRSEDNLWNFLFFTGYLRQDSKRLEGDTRYVTMKIPNTEVRYIYKNTIQEWFGMKVKQKDLSVLYHAIEQGDIDRMSRELSLNLQETISFYDYVESFYHGFMAGLLKNMKDYRILSNRESGDGRPDLILRTPSVRGRAIIIEIKVVDKLSDLEGGCEAALRQIEERRYEASLKDEGYETIIKYGICFYKKECLVKAGR